MAIKVVCPSCGAKRSLPDAYRGRTVTCPKCSQKFAASEAPSSSGSSDSVQVLAQSEPATASRLSAGTAAAERGPVLAVALPGAAGPAESSEPATRLASAAAAETRISQPEPHTLPPQEATPTRPAGAPSAGPAKAAGREYKVLTRKNLWFTGEFNPEAFEEALNTFAKQGWTVKSTLVMSVGGPDGNRDELVVVLER